MPLELISSNSCSDSGDTLDTYYKCITSCSWIGGEDPDCVTKCLDLHLNKNNDPIYNKNTP